jgi:hypothetical protein
MTPEMKRILTLDVVKVCMTGWRSFCQYFGYDWWKNDNGAPPQVQDLLELLLLPDPPLDSNASKTPSKQIFGEEGYRKNLKSQGKNI